jgi:pyridoxamine 5'-phosphate oxidase
VSDLQREDLAADPFTQFGSWFEVACNSDIEEANAMSLATASASGVVSARTVLLKLWDTEGFVFFTNYGSRKSIQIGENPHVALLFYWDKLNRQIEIEGTAERVPMKESIKYFATRPRGSQLGAWCSSQSSVISSREALESKLEEIKRKFTNREVPLPSLWGGFRVTPQRIEFWQRGADRLHDRFQYVRQTDDSWTIERLAP